MGLKKEAIPNWRGGESISSHGYVLIKVDEKQFSVGANKYAYKHRYVMENHLRRKLIPSEIVHHINHNTRDNHIENLMLCNKPTHKYLHRKKESNLKLPGEANPLISCACGCGKVFSKYDNYGRPRKYDRLCSHKKGT